MTVAFSVMLEKLQWPTLKDRRKNQRLTNIFKIVHGLVAVPTSSLISAQIHAVQVQIHLGIHNCIHRVSEKNCAKLFLSELRQISTNFDNFWHKDGKAAEIMRCALIFTSPNLRHRTTVYKKNSFFPRPFFAQWNDCDKDTAEATVSMGLNAGDSLF